MLKFPAETFLTFFLMILGLLIVNASLGYGFGTFKKPGPGLFPFFLGLSIIFTSVVQFLIALRATTSETLFADQSGRKRVFLITLTIIAWILLMQYLGYVIVTLVTTYSLCKIMQLEGWRKPFVLSVSVALAI